ncbi:MAG: sigma-70 family RNA polymerase sigma factor [Candidatus Cloacimonetes bacterium]|nr:sigma-70 family RNA polymerase sigma factor [Candidatus Cloacimonadota bacterium]
MNKKKIVTEYLPLVRSIAAKYNKLGIPQEDLEQEGMIGLLEAANKYEEDKGAKFSTYATYWIKKYILTAVDKEKKHSLNSTKLNEEITKDKKTETIKQATNIDLPSDMPENEKTVLTMLFQEEFTLKEIAEELGISRERVRQLKEKGLRRMRVKKINEV